MTGAPDRDSPAKKTSGKRAYHSKVSTGCITCRRRHIKCDEVKPDCRRCTSAGRKCDGYVIRKAWIFEPSWEKSGQTAVTRLPLVRPMPTEDGRAVGLSEFQYFFQTVSPTLTEWAMVATIQDLSGLVQRYAQSIPAVCHLTVALASRHKDALALSTERSRFALTEYQRALIWLNHAREETCVDTVLLCGILIAVYEHFDPHSVSHSGLPHHTAAFRIFNDPATKWSSVTWAIWAVSQQIDTVVSMLKTPIFLPGSNSGSSVARDIPNLPAAFSSPAEMRSKFYDIFRWRFTYSLHHRDWNCHCPGFLQLNDLANRWYIMVCDFISGNVNGQKPTRQELQLARTMSVQFRMIHAALWYSSSSEGPQYLSPGYANLVDLSSPSEVVISVPIKPNPSTVTGDPSLTFPVIREPTGIWPVVEYVRVPGQPPYVRFTLRDDSNKT